MADFLTKAQRSALMASIKGRANKRTELLLAALFREYGIKGWRRHYPIAGRPDFVFTRAKVAVFVDGCFWHGCPWHYRQPTSNVAFWQSKMEANRNRDKISSTRLRLEGWKVIRVWEHSLSRPEKVVKKISSALDDQTSRMGQEEKRNGDR